MKFSNSRLLYTLLFLVLPTNSCIFTTALASVNNRFSSLFAAGDSSVPAAKSEEKRLFSEATTAQIAEKPRDQ